MPSSACFFTVLVFRGEATDERDLDVLVDFEDSDTGRQISLLGFTDP